MTIAKQFGEFFKEKRIQKGMTLRQFCEVYGFDPGNMSKMERGLLLPPQGRDKLEQYAHVLGIEEGSDEWYDFFDRAALCNGQIPREILNDEELVKKLPVIFRSLRGEKPSQEKLAELAEAIRRA